jgi:hypothetical protein
MSFERIYSHQSWTLTEAWADEHSTRYLVVILTTESASSYANSCKDASDLI